MSPKFYFSEKGETILGELRKMGIPEKEIKKIKDIIKKENPNTVTLEVRGPEELPKLTKEREDAPLSEYVEEFKILYGQYELVLIEYDWRIEDIINRNFKEYILIPKSKLIVIKQTYYSTEYGKESIIKIIVFTQIPEVDKYDIFLQHLNISEETREFLRSNRKLLEKIYSLFEEGYSVTEALEIELEIGESWNYGSWSAGYEVIYGEIEEETIEESYSNMIYSKYIKIKPKTEFAVIQYWSSGALSSWNKEIIYILKKSQ